MSEAAPEEEGKESPPPAKPRPTLGQRAKSALRKAAMLALSVTFSGCIGEGLIRLSGRHFESSLHTPDRDLGWDFRPGARGWSTLEGRTFIEVNSDGCNDREHAVDKPTDTIRIAVLGDSFTGNYNIPREQSWWSVMERKLNECPALAPRKVEVLAFGTGGFGTAQELIMMRRKVWKYSPDVVLLQFFGGNDLLDNKREIAPVKANDSPYFLLQGDELVLDDSFKKKLPGPTWLWARNTFADTMNHVELALFIKLLAGARQRAKTHIIDSRPKDLGYPDNLPFQTPKEPNMIEAWRVTEALLRQMKKEVREHGAEFRMMAVSSPEQVHPDLSERAEFIKAFQLETLFYVEERLAKLAEKEGVAFYSTSQPLADYTAQNHAFVHGFANGVSWGGHWNELGHRLAGEWIAADYCKRLESPKAGAAPAPTGAAP